MRLIDLASIAFKLGEQEQIRVGKLFSLLTHVRTLAAVTLTDTFIVADLPAEADTPVGARATVTDANSTTFRSVVAGGGSNIVPVFNDGTDWRIG